MPSQLTSNSSGAIKEPISLSATIPARCPWSSEQACPGCRLYCLPQESYCCLSTISASVFQEPMADCPFMRFAFSLSLRSCGAWRIHGVYSKVMVSKEGYGTTQLPSGRASLQL